MISPERRDTATRFGWSSPICTCLMLMASSSPRSIKERSDLGAPVVVLLTSGGRVIDDAGVAEADVAACLLKPVKHSELLDTILSVMGVTTLRASPEVTRDASHTVQPLRVLLAEDSLANQRLAVGMLEKTHARDHRRPHGCRGGGRMHRRNASMSCSWICRCPRWTDSIAATRDSRTRA